MLETIASKIALSVLNKLISLGITKINQSEFSIYELELKRIIEATIEEYERLYPIREESKIPFYTSAVLFEELLQFRFTATIDKNVVLQAIRDDERIIVPSEAELGKFFDLFDHRINASAKLRNLNVQCNYKEEIFSTSKTLKEARDLILSSINELKQELNSHIRSNALTRGLLDEWSKQLDEILDHIKAFKPLTALDRLRNLEKRISDAGLEKDTKLFSRLYYMQAQCFSQMEDADKLLDEAELVVKAFTLNPNNDTYKQSAAIAYYVLKEKGMAKQLTGQLLHANKFDPISWVIEIYEAGDKFKDVLSIVPEVVKAKDVFKLRVYHWLLHNNYIKLVAEFDELGLAFEIDLKKEPEITYLNRHTFLVKALYLFNKFYEKQKTFTTNLSIPNAKNDEELAFANKVLAKVVDVIKGTEIEKFHHLYFFLYYWSFVMLHDEISHVHDMEIEFNKITDKSPELVLRMAQAYNSLKTEQGTRKSIKILEEYEKDQNELTLLLTLINYSNLKEDNKIEEYFNKYVDYHFEISRNCLLNSLSFLRRGLLPFTDSVKNKLLEIYQRKSFETVFLKNVFRISIYVAFEEGFSSTEEFHKHLQETIHLIGSDGKEFLIHIAFGLAQIKEYEQAIELLKTRIPFDAPSEEYKLYCKILYQAEGHKPELIQHLQKWRADFRTPDYELLEMELYLSQLQRNWKETIKIARLAIEYFPNSEKFLYFLFAALHESADVEGIRGRADLIEDKLFKSEGYAVSIAMALLKAGLHQKALDLLFSQASKKNNIQARQQFITLSIHIPDELLTSYEVVEPGTYVVYSIADKKHISHVTEENKTQFPQKILVGKKVGEAFSFRKPMVDTLETGTILRVCDKYLALIEEIMLDAENPVSGLDIHVMHFDGDTAEDMNKTFIDNYGVQGTINKERVEDQLEKYYSGSISFSEVTNSVFRRDFIDAYYTLSDENGKLFKAVSPAVSPAPIITEQSKWILDFTSCCLFFELSTELNLKYDRKFIISAFLKDEIVKKLEEEKASPKKELSITITKEAVRPYFYPEDFKDRRIKLFKGILNWVNSNCLVEPVPERLNFILGLNEEHKIDGYLQLLLENKLLADKEAYLLLTNDVFYYRQFQCQTSKVLSPLHYLDRFHVEYRKPLTEYLLRHNYVGVTLTAEILSDELFKMLGGKDHRFGICLENLRYNWNPNNQHLGETIRFVKTLYLSSFLTDNTRQNIVATVFSNLIVGSPNRLVTLMPNLIMREFRLLPVQMIEVLQILAEIIRSRR